MKRSCKRTRNECRQAVETERECTNEHAAGTDVENAKHDRRSKEELVINQRGRPKWGNTNCPKNQATGDAQRGTNLRCADWGDRRDEKRI